MAAHLILVGQVAGAFGVRGEARITTHTESPLNLLDYSPLMRADGSTGLHLTAGRAVKGALIVSAKEIETREQAQALRGLRLYIDRAALPPAEDDEFYLADLIGLAASAPDGKTIGRVKSVHNFGAGDLLEIEPGDGGPSWWAPFTKAVVPQLDLAGGTIIVDRPAETEAEA